MEPLGYAAAAIVVFVALSLAEVRLVLHRSAPVTHLLLIWLGVAAALAVLVIVTRGASALPVAIASIAVYLVTAEALLFVYAAALTSLSIRILVDAVDREPDPDALVHALARHPPEAFLDVRLDNFIAKGHLTLTAGHFRVTARGRRWAQKGRMLKSILAVGHGG